MTENELRTALDYAAKDFRLSDAARQRIRQGAKGEVKMKKKLTMSFALSMALALICVTALAVGGYFSVREFLKDEKTAQQLEQGTLPIEKTWDNERIAITLGDAYYDEGSFAMAMNLDIKDAQKPVFLYPKLRAYQGGRELELDINGSTGGDFWSGFVYPSLDGRDAQAQGRFAFDGTIMDEAASGEVRWEFTMQVLSPNWPIVAAEELGYDPGFDVDWHEGMTEQEQKEAYDRFTAYMTDAFRAKGYDQQKILTTYGNSLVEYSTYLPGGVETADVGKLLIDSGAFTLLDTVTCEYGSAQ